MVTKPEITLKAININTRLSEETPAYSAKLYVDGEYFADVSNAGHGGCDNIHFKGGKFKRDELESLEKRIAATHPKHDMSQYDMEPMDESLEVICHTLVWDHVDRKSFRSLLRRKILIVRDGKICNIKGKKTDALLTNVVTFYGESVTLNAMPFEKAWEIAKGKI
jgi:hypothetical protein